MTPTPTTDHNPDTHTYRCSCGAIGALHALLPEWNPEHRGHTLTPSARQMQETPDHV